MKVTKETPGATEVVLNVEIDSEDQEPFINRSYRRMVSRIQIPGFRRGKAPRSIVENYVGRTALIHEALDFMIPEMLDKVLKSENLQAFAQPEVELLEVEPVSFKAVVPLEPLVDLGDFRELHLERESVTVTDEQVEDVVEQLRRQSAPWEPVTRSAQFGDLLNLDVRGTIEGAQVISDRGVDYIPERENQLPFPGFSIYLEGMTEGQEKEFTLTIPEDYSQAAYAGKECGFLVKVLSIKEKKLPPLDDEFAKGVGEGYENLIALRSFVRARLTDEGEKSALRRLQEQCVGQLLKTASVQASGLIFQREVDLMQDERARILRSQRLDMDAYLRAIGKTEEELREEMRPRAEERLTRYLVLRKLAQEEGIEVSAEEVDSEIESLVASSGESEATVRRTFSTESGRDSVRSSILTRKVMQRLVEIMNGPSAATVLPEGAAAQEGPESSGAALPAGASANKRAKPAEDEEGVETDVD